MKNLCSISKVFQKQEKLNWWGQLQPPKQTLQGQTTEKLQSWTFLWYSATLVSIAKTCLWSKVVLFSPVSGTTVFLPPKQLAIEAPIFPVLQAFSFEV